jgi:ERCC4-type nuclease
MLTVDPREGSQNLVEPLSTMGVPVRKEKLEFGDVAFVGNGPEDSVLTIGIEYKTVPDLLASWHDGRLLGHQLPGMLNSFAVVYLLVEGIISADTDDRIRQYTSRGRWENVRSETKYSNLAGWLESLRHLYGVHVLTSANLLTSTVQVASTYRWWQKEYSTHGTPVTIHTPNLRRDLIVPTRIMKVAATFPGVGSEKLLDIEARFGSIREMVNADAATWRQVDGVGKKTAEAIVKYLEEK